MVVGSYVTGLTMRTRRLPVGGETVLADEFDHGPGGKGSNQAIQIARAGARARLLSAVGDDAFGQDALDLWARSLGAYEHQDAPFEVLVDRLNPARSLTHHPVVQVMLAWQNTTRAELALGNLEITEMPLATQTARMDLVISLGERIRAAVACSTLNTERGDMRLSVSIGAHLAAPGEPMEEILLRADHALYAAKEAGRNCLRVNGGREANTEAGGG